MVRLLHRVLLSLLCGCCFLLAIPIVSLSLKPLKITASTSRRLSATGEGITTGFFSVPSIIIASSVPNDYCLSESIMSLDKHCNLLLAGITVTFLSSLTLWSKLETVKHELDVLKNNNSYQHDNSTKNITTSSRNGDEQNARKAEKKNNALTGKHDSSTENITHSSRNGHDRNKKKSDNQNNELLVKPIGVIRSIYRLCVGTPRQGLLAGDARGRIELYKLGDSSIRDSVSGLDGFSYIWIIFQFHLNTKSSRKGVKSKISPPALGGKKVGIFCTRSPHRPNPIGMTLCKLDKVDVKSAHNVTLHVSGLDLVDGTPVIDIKPYVSVYDSVNSVPGSSPLVPEWVQQGLATLRNVSITETAKNELEEILHQDPYALEFYGPHCGRNNDDTDNEANTVDTMLRVIQQVLAIDVRSSFQTRKARTGRSNAERAVRVKRKFEIETITNENDDEISTHERINTPIQNERLCTQQLDNLLISFSVKEVVATREQFNNSGAEDEIIVKSIQLLQKSTRPNKV